MRSSFGLSGAGLVLPVCLGLTLLTAGNLFFFQGTPQQPLRGQSVAGAAPIQPQQPARTARTAAGSKALASAIAAAEDSAPAVRAGSPTKPANSKQVLALQRELAAAGYQAGGETGVLDMMTRGAILAFEQDHGLPLTAEPSDTVFKTLLAGVAPASKPRSSAHRLGPEAAEVIKRTQALLRKLGYRTGEMDGVVNDQTARSIRQFESASGLPPTGRVSGVLLAELARMSRSQLDVAASDLPQ